MKLIKKSEKTLRGGFKKRRKGSEKQLRLGLSRISLYRRLKMSENELRKRKQNE